MKQFGIIIYNIKIKISEIICRKIIFCKVNSGFKRFQPFNNCIDDGAVVSCRSINRYGYDIYRQNKRNSANN